jgi:hypothetical protein
MQVDINDRRPTGRFANQVRIPDFFKQCSLRWHRWEYSSEIPADGALPFLLMNIVPIYEEFKPLCSG